MATVKYNAVVSTPADAKADAGSGAAAVEAPVEAVESAEPELELPAEPAKITIDEPTQSDAADTETARTDGAEVAEGTVQADDPAETLDLPPPPSPTLTKLKELDPALFDGDEPDETKIVQAIHIGRQAQAYSGFVQSLLAQDPEFNVASLRALKKVGHKLNASDEAILAAAPKPQTQPFAVPAEVATEYNALLKAGKYAEAAAYMHEKVTQPQIEAEVNARATREGEQRQRRAVEEQQAKLVQRENKQFSAEMASLAKRFPTLVKVDPKADFGVRFLGSHGQTLRDEIRRPPTMTELADLALRRKGWLKGSPTQTTRTATAARPQIRNIAPTQKRAAPVQEGQVRIPYNIRIGSAK